MVELSLAHGEQIFEVLGQSDVDLIQVVEVDLLSNQMFPEQLRQVQNKVSPSPDAHTHQDTEELKVTQLLLSVGLTRQDEAVLALLLRVSLVSTRRKQVQKLLLCATFQSRRLELFAHIGEELTIGPSVSHDMLIFEHDLECDVRLST